MNRYDTSSGPRKTDVGLADRQEKEKMKFPSFQVSFEIEKTTNLQKVLEEWILDNQVELSL